MRIIIIIALGRAPISSSDLSAHHVTISPDSSRGQFVDRWQSLVQRLFEMQLRNVIGRCNIFANHIF